MTDRVTAPYGAWPSPISAADVAGAGVRLGFPTVRGAHVWWQEARPESGGRTVIVHRSPDGTCTDLIDAPWNARTRVHEYGGRAYLPIPRGDGFALVFANYDDQRLYLAEPGAEPVALTPEPEAPGALRYAELIHNAAHDEIWCVVETHAEGDLTRMLAAVPLDGSAAADPAAVRPLVEGGRFYASPLLSPDGSQLAWVTWDHPRMPWDGTQLRIAPVDEAGRVGKTRGVKGGPNESVLAPWWRDETTLYLVSDWSGWWNPYEVGIFGEPPLSLYPAEEEFAGPPWQLGNRPFVVLGDGRLVVLHGHGDLRIAIIDPETAELADLEVPYTHWHPDLAADGQTVVGIAGGPDRPMAVVRLDTSTGEVETLRAESGGLPDPAYLPEPVETEFEGPFGRPVHAYVYPPANPAAQAPEGELPPYIVWTHGGPTSNVSGVYDLEKAYFTSRGIGVVDVNYGGSTGYGRAYRERLREQWGVVDVEDAVAVARSLAESGLADAARLGVRGGSSGGWTTLAAVTTTDVFAAGTSYYGVSDARKIAEETHDFESRYVDGLIGPLPGFARRYTERAPITNADQASCPVLLLQGLDDPIVPPAQSERFAMALADRKIPYAYIAFEGESHGFRRAETKIAALEAELSFYGQTLGFAPPDIPKIELSPGRP
ncbi:MAG TPA: prolyl oligopeptidase family serine peptidase [Streptosporangiaceae bacterium]|jgi:dipeptidyl aminopeptidase/acylaminoacyl peptidase